MTPETKAIVLSALWGRCSNAADNLARANRAFEGLSEEEMLCEHGNSGSTRFEILAGYISEASEIENAIREVEEA